MRSLRMFAVIVLAMAPVIGATHGAGVCEIASAWGDTYLVYDVPADLNEDGREERFYSEERGNPFGSPLPLSAFLFGTPPGECDGLCTFLEGEGSWFYEESNGLVGLQRGGVGLLGGWYPAGCDHAWGPVVSTTPPSVHPENAPEGVPCLINDAEKLTDETCGHGPDELLFQFYH